jgi:peptidoglycan/LPS O-acetylase OafA/YrhL
MMSGTQSYDTLGRRQCHAPRLVYAGPMNSARPVDPGPASAKSQSSNLDILRAIAVSTVFLFHLALGLGRAAGHDEAWMGHGFDPEPIGRSAVLLFFVHTSFVLMQSLERSEIAGDRIAISFFIRRAFRIYPLSIVCVLAILALRIPHSFYSNSFEFPTWRALIANLLLFQNATKDPSVTVPLWSLPYEVQMYALLPLVYLTVRLTRSAAGAVLCFVGSALAAPAAFMVSYRAAYLTQFLPCFMAGAVAYRLTARHPTKRWPSWCWPISIVGLMALYIVAINVQHISIWAFSNRGCFIAGGICLILGCALPRFKHATNPVLVRVSKSIAKYSYGIYLTHMSVIWFSFIRLQGIAAPLRWLIFLLLSVSVPIALFHIVENPLIAVGRKLSHAASEGLRSRQTVTSS